MKLVLFEGTIRDNLDPFSEQTDSELFEALKKVQLSEIESLSSRVEEGGSNWSVGQRQLICKDRCIV